MSSRSALDWFTDETECVESLLALVTRRNELRTKQFRFGLNGDEEDELGDCERKWDYYWASRTENSQVATKAGDPKHPATLGLAPAQAGEAPGSEFSKHLQYCEDVVATWPEWKQNILGDFLSPQVRHPRKVVDNSGARSRSEFSWSIDCVGVFENASF